MYTIGIDIGGTHLRIGLVGKSGETLHFEKIPQAEVLHGDSPANLADFIFSYASRTVGSAQIAGICAALPAAISRDRGTVLNAPNIQGFNGVGVKSLLEQRLKLPFFLERDVNVQLYYDLTRFDLLQSDCVVSCYVGTGLGNAIYLEGKLLLGHNGVAGELGHIPTWGLETHCSCGNSHCVEPLVAGKYLALLQKEHFPNTPVGELFLQQGEDPLLAQYVQHLALPIATAVNLMDPENLILGGGVLNMPAFPKTLLESEIRRHTRKPQPEANLKFYYSTDDRGENGVIGAGLYAWKQIK